MKQSDWFKGWNIVFLLSENFLHGTWKLWYYLQQQIYGDMQLTVGKSYFNAIHNVHWILLYKIFYALYSTHCFLNIVFIALYSMHYILCIVLYALFYIQSILLLYSMHCILCLVFYRLYSMQDILCIVVYALLKFYSFNSMQCILWVVYYTFVIYALYYTHCSKFSVFY